MDLWTFQWNGTHLVNTLLPHLPQIRNRLSYESGYYSRLVRYGSYSTRTGPRGEESSFGAGGKFLETRDSWGVGTLCPYLYALHLNAEYLERPGESNPLSYGFSI